MLSGELQSRSDIAKGDAAKGPEEIAQEAAERDKVKGSLGEVQNVLPGGRRCTVHLP